MSAGEIDYGLSYPDARRRLLKHFSVQSLEGFGVTDMPTTG